MHLIDERTRGFGGASFVFERGVGGVSRTTTTTTTRVGTSSRSLELSILCDLSILYDLAPCLKKASRLIISQIVFIGRAVKGGNLSHS